MTNNLGTTATEVKAQAKAEEEAEMAAVLGPRPRTAKGTFLRVLTINDVYKLDNYPRVAKAVRAAKAEAARLDCVVVATLNGDFLSPCVLSAIDGGRAMTEALNHAQLDYVVLGNHEMDFGFDVPMARMAQFRGKAVNTNILTPKFRELPKFDVLAVGERHVVVMGLLSEDTSIYSPSNKPLVQPPAVAAAEAWAEAKAQLGKTPDMCLPMTHMLVPEDKKTAVALSRHAEMGTRTPVLLGGHEHEVYIDEAGKSTIVKAGEDARQLGVVDIWWTADGTLRSKVTMLPIDEFDEDPAVKSFVLEKQAFIGNMMRAPIAPVAARMSSKTVRFEPSGVASFLLTYVRRALAKDHVDMAMVQGGGVRAAKDYEPGTSFTMGDLFGEFAFASPFCTIPLTGACIQECLIATRSSPKPAPNFLHCDAGVVVDAATHAIESINGAPFKRDKVYRVATDRVLLMGLNVIEPLMAYVSAHVAVPSEESCRPVKDIVLEACMKDEWRRLVGYPQFDADGDGELTADELRAGLGKVFSEIDVDGNGRVSREELAKFVGRAGGHASLLPQLIMALDANGDGMIDRGEFTSLAF